MNTKKIVLISMLALCGTFCMGQNGCEQEKVDKVTIGMNKVADAITISDPLAAALEDVSGIALPADRMARLETIMANVQYAAAKAQVAAGAIGTVAPVTSPYAIPISGILGAIAAIAASIKAFSANRKRKVAEKAVDVLVIATEPLKEAGKAITTAARDNGVADYVETRYKAVIAK